MNKRGHMKERIHQHGEKLEAVFETGLDPGVLARKLRHIEIKTQTIAEQYCNGEIDSDMFDSAIRAIEGKLDAILGYRIKDIPVFINSDPRGYALKIDTTPDHEYDLPRDWGGYPLLAPDLREP